jgi:hypothetical protein
MRENEGDYSSLSERIRDVRMDLFGEYGGPILAGRLRIQPRTLARMEAGGPVAGVLILKLIEVTGVNPHWLLCGDGEKFGHSALSRVDGGRQRPRSAG